MIGKEVGGTSVLGILRLRSQKKVVKAGRHPGLELIIPGQLFAPEQNVTLPMAPSLFGEHVSLALLPC